MTDITARLSTALADRYQIERRLGEGGMATVYLAEDLRHHRKVAVKVLRPELSETVGPERFVREIEIAAGLHHPHILPLYDSGEADGFLFFVMPYVQGESLRDRLAREGELPIGDVVRILKEVADALAKAHAQGVVHRDIKPDNIMLADRHALVADFGVAKAISEATGRHSITTVGVALGTPSYMSPEQASADPHIDHRADIYAFGAMAYEMLTGAPPFTGSSPQQILAAHVTEPATPVTTRRTTVPAPLADLVMRCLEKKAADRWQNADELLARLEAIATPSAGMTPTDTAPVEAVDTPRRRVVMGAGMTLGIVVLAVFAWSMLANRGAAPTDGTSGRIPIAVLVFENRTASEDDEYVSEGIAEDISTQLSKVGGFAVKAHASARRLSREEMSYGEIASELGVDYLVHGNWRRSGDSVRVTARLIAPESEEQLWAESYNREMTAANMFGVRSDVAAQVAAALDIAIAPEKQEQLAVAPTANTEAYTAYQLGRFFWNKRTEAGLLLAIEHFSQAIERDSSYALAYSGLADSYSLLPAYGSMRPHEAFPIAREAASRALEIDSMLAEAHTTWAFIKFTYDWKWEEAEESFKRAISLNPDYAMARFWHGGYLVAVGRIDEGLAEVQQALDLDPLSLIIGSDFADLLTVAGRYDEALALVQRTIGLDSTFQNAHAVLASTFLAMGRPEDALAVADRINDLPLLAEAHAKLGNRDQALEALARMLEQQTDPVRVARVYLALGDTAQAFEWLDRGVEVRSSWIAWPGLRRPVWSGIRDHPRFREILRRVGLE